ncbi:hypothetical protein K438DRAFT_1973894 [Mycena galopus ATCC 62051]|nr:hypothetical protein K438DRAFT_1973894 [Mycena galopus ATCC 62051]
MTYQASQKSDGRTEKWRGNLCMGVASASLIIYPQTETFFSKRSECPNVELRKTSSHTRNLPRLRSPTHSTPNFERPLRPTANTPSSEDASPSDPVPLLAVIGPPPVLHPRPYSTRSFELPTPLQPDFKCASLYFPKPLKLLPTFRTSCPHLTDATSNTLNAYFGCANVLATSSARPQLRAPTSHVRTPARPLRTPALPLRTPATQFERPPSSNARPPAMLFYAPLCPLPRGVDHAGMVTRTPPLLQPSFLTAHPAMLRFKPLHFPYPRRAHPRRPHPKPLPPRTITTTSATGTHILGTTTHTVDTRPIPILDTIPSQPVAVR